VGAGAAGFAAILKERGRLRGRKVAAVLSGGNVDREVFAAALSAGR
jgi:threonine dehydratase